MENIQAYAELELFEAVPDYAIDALWLEWERVRRKNPPDNMICTSGKSYQAFCKLVGDRGDLYPCAFTSRETLLDITELPAVTYKREEVQRLRQTLAGCGEEDKNTYVAFIYEGLEYRNVIEAVAKKLMPQYLALRSNHAAG